jgi:hypothetical protein
VAQADQATWRVNKIGIESWSPSRIPPKRRIFKVAQIGANRHCDVDPVAKRPSLVVDVTPKHISIYEEIMSLIADQTAAPITTPLRDWVQKIGMLTPIRNLRGAFRRDVPSWVARGCPSPAPNIVKMSVVRHHVTAFGTKVFVETGTYLGSMVEYVATTGVQCHTIEIDPVIYERAQKIVGRHSNINLILGDSGVALPELLKSLTEPATFWLDGHYSGSFTGRSELDTPVSAELDHILEHPIKKHVILIDDARDFTGVDGYPKLSSLLAHFDDHPNYRAEVSADIIRITPR